MRLLTLLFIFFSLAKVSGFDDPKYRIVGQKELRVSQGNSITIQLTDLFLEDAEDHDYPEDFKLKIFDGKHYTRSENTVYPKADFYGVLIVPVQVRKKGDESQVFDLQINVEKSQSPTNLPPTIIGQKELSTQMDQPIAIEFSDLTVTDLDDSYPKGFTMTIAEGDNYSVNGHVITPQLGFTGRLNAPVTVNDGQANSQPYTLKVEVIKPANVAPSIIGHIALTTEINTSIKIEFSHLKVIDLDDEYPKGFHLKVSDGDHYTVKETTITPAVDFVGSLSIPVIVNDGKDDSAPFNLTINVTKESSTNIPPTITGQTSLSINKNSSLTLTFAHLTVTDPDNIYPNGFSLALSPGTNYTIQGKTITPARDFVGKLSVPTIVNDGTDNSAVYNVTVQVIDKTSNNNIAPVITGQVPLVTSVNTSIAILLSHLRVTDPDNNYPNQFTLVISPGENYTAVGNTIFPAENFLGPLYVPVAVNDGISASPLFTLKVEVVQKNSNTTISIIGQRPVITTVNQSIAIRLSDLIIDDPSGQPTDQFTLSLAPGDHYTLAETVVTPQADYKGALQVPVMISNGVTTSLPYLLKVDVVDDSYLFIPSAFTPNGDNANDTWQIQALKDADRFKEVVVRVYNKAGVMLFEATGLDIPWDGKLNGVALPADTYFYTLLVSPINSSLNKKGIIMLLR